MNNPSNVVVGLDPDTTDIIVAFEGTHNPKELINELTHFVLVDYTPHSLPGAQVDTFFIQAYNDGREKIINAVTELYKTAGQRVLVTGHSLGGAIAALAALDIVLSKAAPTEVGRGNGDRVAPAVCTAVWFSFRITHFRT